MCNWLHQIKWMEVDHKKISIVMDEEIYQEHMKYYKFDNNIEQIRKLTWWQDSCKSVCKESNDFVVNRVEYNKFNADKLDLILIAEYWGKETIIIIKTSTNSSGGTVVEAMIE